MEEVKKKIEKLMFEQQNNNNNHEQGHWTNSQPHNGIPVDHTDLQTQLPRTPTPS